MLIANTLWQRERVIEERTIESDVCDVHSDWYPLHCYVHVVGTLIEVQVYLQAPPTQAVDLHTTSGGRTAGWVVTCDSLPAQVC